MRVFTKESLIQMFLSIQQMGWVPNARPGNDGAVGNTLEDLLGITENNLPLANAGEWEIKAQRANTRALGTLCHLDPSPRAVSLVTRLLLPKYGWVHKKAGTDYPAAELSFRQTISAPVRTDRGFGIEVDHTQRKVVVSFDANAVDQRHADWLESVRRRAGIGELSPQPYWGISDLLHKVGSKLHNCFFLLADSKKVEGMEHFRYSKILMLSNLDPDRLLDAIEVGKIKVDFDVRTGHNHGTKFRMYRRDLPAIYGSVTEVT